MADTRLLSAHPAELLQQDHDRLRHLFAEHARTAPELSDVRTGLFRQIRQELRVHGAIEREHVYPALKDHAKSISEDHAAMDALADKLSEMNPGDKSHEALLKLLEEGFTVHAAAEERDLFPRLDRLSPLARQEMTLQMERTRERLGHSD